MQVDSNVFGVAKTEKRLRMKCIRKLEHWCDPNVLKIWNAIFICSTNFTLLDYFRWCTSLCYQLSVILFIGYARYRIRWAPKLEQKPTLFHYIYLINGRVQLQSHLIKQTTTPQDTIWISLFLKMFHFTEYY